MGLFSEPNIYESILRKTCRGLIKDFDLQSLFETVMSALVKNGCHLVERRKYDPF